MNARTPPTPLSYSAIWADAAGMLGANRGLLTAIAGVFLFLPAVLEARFFPPPEGWTTIAQWVALMQEHSARHWPWMLLSMMLNLVGVTAIYLLLLASPRLTVGRAVVHALAILPFYFLMQLVVNLALGAGLMLFIVPFFFLLGKLVLAAPILVAETQRAPFTAIQLAWKRSEGRAWAIAGLWVLVYAAALIVSLAVRVGLGIMVLLLLGRDGLGGLLLALLHGAVVAVVSVVITVLVTAIYRAVSPAGQPSQPRPV